MNLLKIVLLKERFNAGDNNMSTLDFSDNATSYSVAFFLSEHFSAKIFGQYMYQADTIS